MQTTEKSLASIVGPIPRSEDGIQYLRKLASKLTAELYDLAPHEFLIGLLYKTLIEDILGNCIEDDYVQHAPVQEFIDRLIDTWNTAQVLRPETSHEDWFQQLLRFAEEYHQLPMYRRSGDYTTVKGIKFFVASGSDPLIGPPIRDQERDPAYKLFPSMDATLGDPMLARDIMRWYLDRLIGLQSTLRANGDELGTLCFVEKPYSGTGALGAMGYLVDQLAIPAAIFRNRYWDLGARVRGEGPQAGQPVVLIYDVAINGSVLVEAVLFLQRNYNVQAVAALVLYDFEYDARVALEALGVTLVTYLRRTQVSEELRARQRLLADLRNYREGLLSVTESREGTESEPTAATKHLSRALDAFQDVMSSSSRE